MDCLKVRKMVSPYIDKEIGSPEKRAFELHIDACPVCKRVLEEYITVHHLFASVPRFEAPLGFSTRVLARLEEAEETRSSWLWSLLTRRPFFLELVEVTFALVVVLIGIISGNMLVGDRPSERRAGMEEFFSLGLFQATPPGSIAAIYVSLLGAAQGRGRDTDM